MKHRAGSKIVPNATAAEIITLQQLRSQSPPLDRAGYRFLYPSGSKQGPLFMHLRPLAFAAAILCLTFSARSAQTPPGKPQRPAALAPVPLDTPVTQAVFVNPHSRQEGRDPFFPRSDRPYASFVAIPTKTSQPSVTADLKLGGISGSPEHRLAIINNRTFE